MKNILTILFIFPFVLLGQKTMTISSKDIGKDSINQKTEKINSIFLSDSIHIMAVSRGCFHGNEFYYKIIKKNDSHTVTDLRSNGTKHKLKKEHFNSLQKLCIHGVGIDYGLCTTKKHFRITDGKNTVYFDDYRCSETDDILSSLLKILN